MSSILLQTLARAIGPVLMLFSLALLLRGHNQPGGGFVGGLVAASALTLYVLTYGIDATARAARFPPERIAALGLFLTLGSGAAGLLQGKSFLFGYWTELTLPSGAEIKVGTPLLFDMGVYLVVLSAALSFVLSLRPESP